MRQLTLLELNSSLFLLGPATVTSMSMKNWLNWFPCITPGHLLDIWACSHDYDFDLSKLSCLSTNGAANIVDRLNGVAAKLRAKVEKACSDS